jgi:hypothetical protein
VAVAPATLTEYGWRGVPNLYVTRATCRPATGTPRTTRTPSSTRCAIVPRGVDVQTQRQGDEAMAGILLQDTRRSSRTTSSTT